ncbi:acyl-CoA dehydrogenase [bacterium CPR1]|nr:acyl-CoA dehydrogenase [bacterium CPR1]
MDFDLTEDERAVQDSFARFSDHEVAPRAQAIDETGEFPRDLFGKLAELGLYGLRYPESLGGVGLGLQALCLALEEVARGSLSLAAAASMQALMGTHFLHTLGDSELHESLLKPALRGEKIGALCMTEPDAGSDLLSLTTKATRVEGGYRLDGQKTWVTSAPLADFFTVLARAGEQRELTFFLVERSDPGLAIGRAIHKLGVRGLPTSEVSLDGCLVSESRRLGDEGVADKHLREVLSQIRVLTGALALGVGRAALHYARKYAGQRRQFGQPINRFQAIGAHLADMATSLEAATLLVRSAAWLFDQGRLTQERAAMAKLFASEAAADVCDRAARILASYGFAMEYPIQRYLRDVRFTLIGGGTSEMLKLSIARGLGNP